MPSESEQTGGKPNNTVGKLVIREEDAGSVGKIKKLEPEKEAAFFLAKSVGLLIAVATLWVLLEWVIRVPRITMSPEIAQMDSEKAKIAIDNLKNLNDLSLDNSVRIFDTIVARSLLPVFTAILGYIFGTRSETK